MLRSTESEKVSLVRLYSAIISREFFLQNSNLYDHDT